jgi:hypothetical protein
MLMVEAGGLGKPFRPCVAGAPSAAAAAFAAAFARRFCFFLFTVGAEISLPVATGVFVVVATSPFEDIVVVGEG